MPERGVPILPRHGEDAALGGLHLFRQPLPDHRAQRDVLVSRLWCARARIVPPVVSKSRFFRREGYRGKGKKGPFGSFDTPALTFHPSSVSSAPLVATFTTFEISLFVLR